MAEAINFLKDRARYFLDCVANGKPIEGRLDHDAMMTLAGVCLLMARSHGNLPHRLREQGAGAMTLEHLPEQFLRMTDEQFAEDSRAAVEFYAHLAMLVQDGEYDARFEPEFRAFVYVEDGGNKVQPVNGYHSGSSTN